VEQHIKAHVKRYRAIFGLEDKSAESVHAFANLSVAGCFGYGLTIKFIRSNDEFALR